MIKILTKNTIESCLNWIGYGNLNGPVWIVGKEEGTLEVDMDKQTLEESLEIRSHFQPIMDFKQVWENRLGVQLNQATGKSQPWRFAARFLLALNGTKVTDTSINEFIIKELGRKNSDHLLAEYFPLPKKRVQSIAEYTEFWANINDYWYDVQENRLQMFAKLVRDTQELKLIISYCKTFSADLVTKLNGQQVGSTWLSKNGRDEFTMFRINCHNRQVYLLATPFFGNGRIHKRDIPEAVQKINETIN